MTYTKLIERLRNAGYNPHVDVYALLTEAYAAIEALQSKLDTAIQSSAHWQHQCTELQARLDAMGKGEAVGEVVREDTTYIKWNDKANHLPVGTKLYAAPKALAPEPDMFWNNDDPERQHGSIEEFLNDEICQGQPVEVGAVYTIQQAKRLPNVQIKVTSIDEESCEAEYEVLSAHGIGGTP